MKKVLYSMLILLVGGTLLTGCNKAVEDSAPSKSEQIKESGDPNKLVCHYDSTSWIYEGNNTTTVYRIYTWNEGLLVNGELMFKLNFDSSKVDKDYVDNIYDYMVRTEVKYNVTRESDYVINAVSKENMSGFNENTTKEQVRSVLTGDSYKATCD